MKWALREIKAGDMVRIPMGEIYHYGVCVGEDRMIQFGEPILGNPKPKEEIRISETDIQGFLCGEFAEVADLDRKELKQRRKTEDIIAYAESRLGDGGYDILYNNCEHFANECVFGLHRCSQVDSVREELEKTMPPVFVYFARVADLSDNDNLPTYIKKEIKRITNPRVIEEKRAAYGLLYTASADCFGIKLDMRKCTRDPSGKPYHRDICFSLSHSEGMVAVALSRIGVGCDIEKLLENDRNERISGRIRHENESDTDDTTLLWTQKEAIFKKMGKSSFIPSQIDTKIYQTRSARVNTNEGEFRISVAADNLLNVRWQTKFIKDAKFEIIKQ